MQMQVASAASRPKPMQISSAAAASRPNDASDWQTKSKQLLKTYYLGFAGSAFHDWTGLSYDHQRAKICYALYGPPQHDAKLIESAYTDDQRNAAGQLLTKILECWKDAPKRRLCVGVIFVCCKEDTKEYCLPIFRLLWEEKKTANSIRFIDTLCRVYNSWTDWKNNNTYPKLKYYYPLNGYFSCVDNGHEFDVDKEPLCGFGISPASALSTRFGRVFDVTASIGGFVAGTIGVVALFTPVGFVAAPLLIGSGIVGGTSATYGCARSIQKLVDKGGHGESLADLESLALYFSIAATPLNFVTSLANVTLITRTAKPAQRIFTTSSRVLATILNMSASGIEGALFSMGIANLIEKGTTQQVSNLSVLQLSLSVLFFSNTLVQPRTASTIIKEAQMQRIQELSDSMLDVDARRVFQNLVARNEGGVPKKTEFIKTLTLVNEANGFFANRRQIERNP